MHRPVIEGEKPRCAVFSDGIPDPIFVDGYDHREPYLGDQGGLFEVKPGLEELEALYDYWRAK